MSYIGPDPAEAFTSYATETFTTSSTTSYTLANSVANENELALFINNVRQQPGSGKAYTASGTALTLSAATASTDTMYAIYLGRALQTSIPHTNSITDSMLASAPTASQWRLTSSFSSDATPVASNLEETDTTGQGVLGSSMTQSSGIFTFPSTGYWFVRFTVTGRLTSGSEGQHEAKIVGTTDNSSYADWAETHGSNNGGNSETFASCETIVDVTSTTNVKVRFDVETENSSTSTLGHTTISMTNMTFIRLGDP